MIYLKKFSCNVGENYLAQILQRQVGLIFFYDSGPAIDKSHDNDTLTNGSNCSVTLVSINLWPEDVISHPYRGVGRGPLSVSHPHMCFGSGGFWKVLEGAGAEV